MKNTNNVLNVATRLINDHKAQAELAKREPKLGESVFIGFKTDGNGKRTKGAAEIPFDKVVAIYAERESNKDNKPVYNVQVSSGDVVKIMNSGKSAWQAVA